MTPTSDARSNSQSGFTLLELLVVLSIIVIATALVIPSLGITDNRAFNAQVRRAAAVLTYARRIAIVEGAPKLATFYALDPESSDYDALLAEIAAKKEGANWSSEVLTLRFQDELTRNQEEAERIEVTFFPQGGSTGGVLNFSQDERSAMIRVDSITGRIAVAYNGEELDEDE